MKVRNYHDLIENELNKIDCLNFSFQINQEIAPTIPISLPAMNIAMSAKFVSEIRNPGI